MKNLIFLVSFCIVPFLGYGQTIKDVDVITPFHEDLSAVKKNNQWAFINKDGEKVIDYRNDLVATSNKYVSDTKDVTSVAYPRFNDGRCLVRKLIDDVYYYGYIDKTGKEIIAPKYLNATSFSNGHAIVIKFAKNKVGNNNVLGKRVVTYKLEEYIIDTSGKLVLYLDNARNSIPSRIKNKIPPSFYSKFLAPHIIAVKNKNKKWDIYKF